MKKNLPTLTSLTRMSREDLRVMIKIFNRRSKSGTIRKNSKRIYRHSASTRFTTG